MIDDDEVGIKEVEVSGKEDDEHAMKSKRGEAILPKENEPNVDFKTLPFPQRYIRHNLDKQLASSLIISKSLPSPYHLWKQ